MSSSSFTPDWVSHPGQTISNLLEKRGISSQTFSSNLKIEEETALSLLLGKACITDEIAGQLEGLLGGTKSFWLNREAQYRSELSRLSDELERSEEEEWVKTLSPQKLLKKGWISINEGETVAQACFRFFGISSVFEWRQSYQGSLALAAFRKSPKIASRLTPTAVWFRRCEILAEKITCGKWDKGAFSKVLLEIRNLVRQKNPGSFFPKMQSACASAGVALVVEETPQGCAASGATRLLSENRPVIMLSLRHKTDDHFWFTFFHEAGHLILHENRINLDYFGDEKSEDDEIENQANLFSQQILIPDEIEGEFQNINYNNKLTGKAILRFAKKANISPGIVVGQLQFRRNLPVSRLNTYKRKFDFDQFY